MSTLRDRLLEADAQVDRQGYVWDSLRRIARELDQMRVPYAVAGGIALQHHGYQRSTQDVDLLIGSLADIERIHKQLLGRGYVRKTAGSRHLRDEVTRVRIEFLVAGDFPGDGKPKPVAFPPPESVAEFSDERIAFVNLRALIELKLASAKSAPQRIRDRADVLELIHVLGLTPAFAAQLNPYVRDEFLALAKLPPPERAD